MEEGESLTEEMTSKRTVNKEGALLVLLNFV